MLDDDWQTWWDSWLLHLTAEGRRPRTVLVYEAEIRRFSERVGCGPLDVTRVQVRSWITDLIAEGFAANTINARLISIKSFYSWLVKEGELPSSPAAGLSSPKHLGPDPDVLTDDEFDRLYALTAGREPLARRNRALLLVLDSSGARVSEVVSMTVKGADLKGRHLDVEEKGGGWRPVPISAKAAEAIDRYLRVRRQLKGTEPALWWGHVGNLTISGVEDMLHRLGDRCGVRVTPHRFRHRFAHRWLDAGGSEQGLQVAAGWASPVMPRRYGRSLSVERMLTEHDRLFKG